MGKAHTYIQMVINILGIGKKVKNMGKGHTLMQVDQSMKENSRTGKWMGKESSPGKVV